MNKTDEATLTLKYDLYDLPTAQHKAGLAGLLLMIESMKMRKISPLPNVEYDSSSATISFTAESMQSLFDDIYDALWVEVESKSKWQKQAPKREITRERVDKDGKVTKTKYYVYDQYLPKGEFLKTLLPPDSELWLKLWRNMLWETLRGIPTTRGVYKERADGKVSSEAIGAWETLTKSALRREKGEILTGKVASSALIGAQDRNAENVPFQGIAENNLLLHFWTIASLTFVPRVIRKNKKTKGYQMDEVGYVLAVPEPANLKDFVTDALGLFKSLGAEKSGFRPRLALISIPEESGLEYLYHLTGSRIGQKELAYSLVGVEIYHLEKRGNTVQTLANGRIFANEQLLRGYDSLSRGCRNPLYRSQRIRNLLSQEPWYAGMDSVFSQYPWEFFVSTLGETPKSFAFFGYDARRTFDSIERNLEISNLEQGGRTMTEQTQDDGLANRVYQMTREFVNRRTEEKSGKKYDDFKKNKDEKGRVIYPQEYQEAREKVCSDAFLAMRGRREQDLVEYFTGTICSVAQYLPEEDYIVVSRALINEPNTVKILAMLALSASSAVGRASDNSDNKLVEEGGQQ